MTIEVCLVLRFVVFSNSSSTYGNTRGIQNKLAFALEKSFSIFLL